MPAAGKNARPTLTIEMLSAHPGLYSYTGSIAPE